MKLKISPLTYDLLLRVRKAIAMPVNMSDITMSADKTDITIELNDDVYLSLIKAGLPGETPERTMARTLAVGLEKIKAMQSPQSKAKH